MIDSIPEVENSQPDLKKPRRRQTGAVNLAKVDRLPPHSIEAEQGVLGCVLLSPNECMGEYIQKFKSGLQAFYDLRHQTILENLVEMYDRKDAIDLITLQQKLKDQGQLESIGGIAYLTSLVD